MDAEVLARTAFEIYVQKNNADNVHREIGATTNLLNDLDELVHIRLNLKAGATLYHAGSHFQGLFALKSGFFKLENYLHNGKLQINGFNMMGEVFGFDGIASGKHTCNSVAIEDSEICVIPFDWIEHMGQDGEHLRHHLYRLLSLEIIRNHAIMLLLGSMSGEDRLAMFLLNLSQRLCERGYSATNFILRMTREEIGNHLGLTIETISRIFSKFQDRGLLEVHLKNIRIVDIQGLRDMLGKH
jgi:CRP/FNR family transcriptional regulator